MALPQGAEPALVGEFAPDALVDGRPYRVLVVVDDFPCDCLALTAEPTHYQGRHQAPPILVASALG